MTRIDGRCIKPGSIPADRLDPAIPMGGNGGELPDGSVTPAKLAQALLRRFVSVGWGEAQAGGPPTRTVPLQLGDFLGEPIPAAHILRFTCDDRATLNVGTNGAALSGANSPDLIAQTDAQGRLDLVVSCPEAITVAVAAGPTQGSPLLDASAILDVSFT